MPDILEDAENELSFLGRRLFHELLEQLHSIDLKIKAYVALR